MYCIFLFNNLNESDVLWIRHSISYWVKNLNHTSNLINILVGPKSKNTSMPLMKYLRLMLNGVRYPQDITERQGYF